MPLITYSINDMPTFSAALGSFHVKSSSTSVVNSLMTVRDLPSTFTVTFRCSTTLIVSCLGARWYTDQRYSSMQISRAKHSSRVSVEVTASFPSASVSSASACEESGNDSALNTPLKSPCTTSSALTAAICTGRVSGASACEGLSNDSSGVSAELTASLASVCTKSGVLTAAISTRGASGCEDSCNEPSAIAVISAAADTASEPVLPISVARSSIGGAWVFLMSANPNPETAAMTQPTRITVPHNPAAMIANRRGLMALSSPLFCSEACDGTDLSDQKMIAR